MKDSLINMLKNKYIITGVVFFCWITFFNDIDLIYVLKSRTQLNEIKDQVEELEAKNEHTKALLEDYQSNPKTAEQFAREEYYMKKANEDVFIFRERDLSN